MNINDENNDDDDDDGLDWSPHVKYKIYEHDYTINLADELKRIADKDNNRTKFIKRNNVEYLAVTLETWDEGDDLILHMRRDNLYITGIQVPDGPIYVFTDFIQDFIGENFVDLGYGGNYTILGKGLGLDAYELCYKTFAESVGNLISSMKATKKSPHDWKKSLFCVILVTGEGGRNTVIGYGIATSQHSESPSGIPPSWVKLLVHKWKKASRSAIRYNGEINLNQLSSANKTKLLGLQVKDNAFLDLLKVVLRSSRLCKAMIAIPCPLKYMDDSDDENDDEEDDDDDDEEDEDDDEDDNEDDE